MKILLVHNHYQQHGGEDAVVDQESRLLQEHGHSVSTYLRSNDEIVEYGAMKKIGLAKNTVWAGAIRKDVARLLRRDCHDLVHVHNTFPLISPSIYSACREAGVPVVQTLHNYRLLCCSGLLYRDGQVCEDCIAGGLWNGVVHGCYRGSRLATANVAAMLAYHKARGTWARGVDQFIALSAFAKAMLVRSGLPEARIAVKPNFVHPDPGPCHSTGGDYVIYVGRLSDEKGVMILPAAWERLQHIPLVIVGDGPLAVELKRRFANHGGQVRFTGRLPRHQVMAAIKRARALVCPSECYETFGMSVAEAFACGVPAIVSRIGALAELVQDGVNGLSFRPGNAADLAIQVEYAWRNLDRMRAMSANARSCFEARYSAEETYSQLMRIYEDVCQRATAEPVCIAA